MLFFYCRHGDPIYSPDSLTPLGLRQAEALGRRLARYGLDQIYASSSNRAILTSKPTCEMLHKEASILDWANEGHLWSQLAIERESGGKTWCFYIPSVARRFNSIEIQKLGDDWMEAPDFKGTSIAAGVTRIQKESDSFFASLGLEHDRKTHLYKIVGKCPDRVALFAHQGVGVTLLSAILDIPFPSFSTHFDMSHSAMSVIKFENMGDGYVIPVLLQLSNDAHLYAENLPTKYNNIYAI